MNRVIEWQGGIGKYEKYTFRVEYNPKIDRWYSGVETFPFRAIHIIGQYYTSQQNAKDSCEDFIERKKERRNNEQ